MSFRLPSLVPAFLSIALFIAACDQKPVDLAPETPVGHWRETITISEDLPNITSVWSFGPNDVWVTTTSGVERFDGASWTQPADDIRYASSVWGSSPSDIYVATDDGIWHHDGVVWAQTPVRGELVTGTSSSDVYAVDFKRVLHFNGAEWDTILTADRYLRDISALPGDDCVVTRTDSLLQWNGTGWTAMEAPTYLNDLWRADSDTWFAVGYKDGSDVVWKWDGIEWAPSLSLDRDIDAVWGSGEDDVFVSGNVGMVHHYDGVSWSPFPIITSTGLFALGGSSSSDVYAAGGHGHVLRWDGVSWESIHAIGPDSGTQVMWAATPTHAFLGAGRGSVYEYADGVWSEHVVSACDPYCGDVRDIEGTALDNIFVSAGNTVTHYDGANWSVIADSLEAYILDMCALGSGHVFAAGGGGFLFDGSAWTRTYSGARYMEAVWAASPTCAYMVGEGVLHFDGSTWKSVGPKIHGHSVWGRGCNDVYVAHFEGIAHFDGARWTDIEPYQSHMVHVIGDDFAGVIALGSEGTTFQYDGAVWRIETAEERFYDVGVMLNGNVSAFAQRRRNSSVVVWDGSR